MADGCLTSTVDLVDAVRELLRHSAEPMTVRRIRERLPGELRSMRQEELTEAIERQVAAQVLFICPKYRSSQDRYWDRSVRDHARSVLQTALADGPMSWTDLRKKVPKYARHLADSVLNEELARGTIFRHPPTSTRMGLRYALSPPELRAYAAKELGEMLTRLEQCGFARVELREAIMQLLHEDEWSDEAVETPSLAGASG